MPVEKIKQIISKSILIKVLLSIVGIAILIFYFKVFFTTGVYYEDTFLKKQVLPSENRYAGKGKYGSIEIIVKGIINKQGSADVIYRLPNNINTQYTVTFKDASNWQSGIENIKDEEGKIVFEGEYIKNSPFLIDKSGNPIFEDIQFTVNGESPFNSQYKVSLKSAADFATSSNDTFRGKFQFLFPAIILLIITLIDIRYPRFFFSLKNSLQVRDPEPSDFYLTMQRISWYAYPIIAIVLMIAAVS